ncbi:HNH endonuclease [Streptomyces sp. NBC_00826]|uniref:HNH endonuclease n=1 Tax=Streptomyces sp. NBC_00826 TaxID=2975845 RepID=UPI0038637124
MAWAIEHGSIPTDPDLVADHLCQVTSCVSALHLEWVTTLENYRRIDGRSPVCRRGHPWRGLLPLYRVDSQVRICFRCIDEGPRAKTDRRSGRRRKTDRMLWCPRGHDVSGDNGYSLENLPGRRGCWTCTKQWKASLSKR